MRRDLQPFLSHDFSGNPENLKSLLTTIIAPFPPPHILPLGGSKLKGKKVQNPRDFLDFLTLNPLGNESLKTFTELSKSFLVM